jgi:beta-mannosidase
VVARAGAAIEVSARGAWRANCAELLGRFFDYTYAYRFGPCDHDVVIASLHRLDPEAAPLATPLAAPLATPLATPLSQACYLPDPRAGERYDQAWQAALAWRDDAWWVDIETRRFARRVHIAVPGFIAEEDWFHIAPGRAVHVRLREDAHAPDLHRSGVPVGEIRAINALRPITIRGTR